MNTENLSRPHPGLDAISRERVEKLRALIATFRSSSSSELSPEDIEGMAAKLDPSKGIVYTHSIARRIVNDLDRGFYLGRDICLKFIDVILAGDDPFPEETIEQLLKEAV